MVKRAGIWLAERKIKELAPLLVFKKALTQSISNRDEVGFAFITL